MWCSSKCNAIRLNGEISKNTHIIKQEKDRKGKFRLHPKMLQHYLQFILTAVTLFNWQVCGVNSVMILGVTCEVHSKKQNIQQNPYCLVCRLSLSTFGSGVAGFEHLHGWCGQTTFFCGLSVGGRVWIFFYTSWCGWEELLQVLCTCKISVFCSHFHCGAMHVLNEADSICESKVQQTKNVIKWCWQ